MLEFDFILLILRVSFFQVPLVSNISILEQHPLKQGLKLINSTSTARNHVHVVPALVVKYGRNEAEKTLHTASNVKL